ncbi:MAG: hypothetical protein E7A63_09555 [Clostridium butyricum]|uniref:hypothetical protein n=1 Tax=Clostridium butyricum TaxID=1492 RepID=UPI00136F2B84|nr:hypothetical protein [Clostridium butyricum]MDU1005306.1 hypothetical protein [Clostridium butyricum]MZI79960.1 hypothetical protein [Clostridium butyricum]
MPKKNETQIIKETKYCKIYKKVTIEDDEYNSCIERIEVKEKKREEIRFALYKDTIRGDNRYVPRSLDVTELQLLELIKKAIQEKIFSNEFIEMLKQELNSKTKKS